jgi:xylulokinase
MQALADATQLPVDVVAIPEGAALGSAFIARCVAGLEATMTDARRWAKTARTYEPRSDAEPTELRYERFLSLTHRATE